MEVIAKVATPTSALSDKSIAGMPCNEMLPVLRMRRSSTGLQKTDLAGGEKIYSLQTFIFTTNTVTNNTRC